MAVTGKHLDCQKANKCHFVFYIMKFQKIIVFKTPPVGGCCGSIASPSLYTESLCVLMYMQNNIFSRD